MPVDGKDIPPPTEQELTRLMLSRITPTDDYGRKVSWEVLETRLVRAVVQQMLIVAEVRLK